MSKILVVDDSLVDRQVVGTLLRRGTDYHVEYASNGIEAMELIDASLPLAIVTDLQMPEMDGMELVTQVRRHFPRVPVIVITAHGSEDIALEAIAAGAADFVPKAMLTTDLVRAVEGVLPITAGERFRPKLLKYLRYEELQYDIESDPMAIPPLADHLQSLAADLEVVDETDRVRLAKSLVESLRNAIYHGNLELSMEQLQDASRGEASAVERIAERRSQSPYRERLVHVRAMLSPREGRFTIRDEGPGFDYTKLPDPRKDPSHLTRSGGHGLMLVRMFMDEVHFNDSGNEITLVKRARQHTDAAAPQEHFVTV